MIRNFINITGITPEDELPNKIHDQIIQYSDVETLFIPENNPAVKSIYEIIMEIEIKSHRTIYSALGNILVIDGIKKYKIIYTENEQDEKANILYLNTPYNTFIELPKHEIIDPMIKIYIVDAYFDLLTPTKIYAYTLYLVDVQSDFNSSAINITLPSDMSYKKNSLSKKQTKDFLNEMVISKEFISNEKQAKKNTLVDLDAEYL